MDELSDAIEKLISVVATEVAEDIAGKYACMVESFRSDANKHFKEIYSALDDLDQDVDVSTVEEKGDDIKNIKEMLTMFRADLLDLQDAVEDNKGPWIGSVKTDLLSNLGEKLRQTGI